MAYKAIYNSRGTVVRTRYYATAEQAQDALMKSIGWFHYLGRVLGDLHERGRCTAAARNGGLVSLRIR
jgi:hypothetical protein